ncbi:amino acid adenylation domain-containing protein [Planktothrix sp. FACHB-1355]|uniref:Amino acid adenylation domain-containing protein n=1 Tax=Aerosakkonema funiforme FACHB-1375 TaxID=2949571 RepID=A0A926VI02_9CYAN|nr:MULTISPECIES: non-ribosomal peptide synthetase [Oscillatoriales]MBD2183513.1 amino acid adenylation domain-containing protein [Aerosakkonema funiforme FACHB-1375]MBD3559865.1 amino acid adenylation domain-containing protein [Planktothrix sp. FACHB-1355]
MNQRNIEEIYPLSPMQQGMLFHSLYAPTSGMYVEQLTLQLNGNLDVVAFKQAWQEVVNRHSVLRTAFVWENLEKPLQVVGRQVSLPWQQVDWRELSTIKQQQQLEALLETEQKRGFELSKAPLMNFTLIQLAENSYQFIWNHHHLLLDGWSLPLIFKEVITFYAAFYIGKELYLEKPRPYRDYIAWLQQQNVTESEAFWREKLKGFTAPTAILSQPQITNKQSQIPSYDEQQLKLSAETTAALQSLVRKEQLTLNSIVQGAWALLLSRYSGEQDIVYGATVSGRPPTLAGAESMVGLFINTLPVRVWVDSHDFILPWLKQFQTQLVELRQYEYNSLIEIQAWSEVPRGVSLFDSIVVFENYPVDSAVRQLNSNLEMGNFRTFGKTNYPLTVTVIPDSELLLKIGYVCDRFHTDTIKRMLGHLETLLLNIVANPTQRLSELSLLTATERYQLLIEFNQKQSKILNSKFLIGECIHQLFEEQVNRTPTSIAVVYQDHQLTYRELNAKANSLAHYLRSLGVAAEVKVGICLERSLDLIVAVLAVLKAGGAYVPLDPAYPQERLAFMLKDAQLSLVISHSSLVNNFEQNAVICLDKNWEKVARESESNPVNRATSDNLAYIIYTSGSTGQSKGVMVEHGSLVNAYLAWEEIYQLSEQPTCHLQMASFAFDVFSGDMVRALCSGGKLVLCDREHLLDAENLYQLMLREKVDCAEFVPAVLRNLIQYLEESEQRLDFMRLLVCGSDSWYGNEYNKFRQFCSYQTRLINSFGVTEATIDSSYFESTNLDLPTDQLVPIGKPFPNTHLYILDTNLQPVPIGVTGELYISGAGLARGYLNRPELTTEKFIANPFESSKFRRLYKTGDLARYLHDGNIEFLGRSDNQVKIRGYRIELGEIEATLNQHPAIQQAVVLAREDRPGNKQLIAYCVARSHYKIEDSELKSEVSLFLATKLPEYMMPSSFILLKTLPLTPNGKIDRKRLPIPVQTETEPQVKAKNYRTPTQEILSGIWIQVLGIQSIGITDNFFQLGGHSLLATQVISRIRKAFQLEFPLRYLFESPTIAELSQRIEAEIKAGQKLELPPIASVPREGNLTLSFAQQRLWFANQLLPGNPAYNMPVAVRLFGSLNVKALEQSLNEVIKRHESLRTSFIEINGEPVQQIAPTLNLTIPIVDLREFSEIVQKAQQLAIAEVRQPFALDKAPLLRVKLLELGENDWVILFTMHHIISDAWSLGILIQEIAIFYEAFCIKKTSILPNLSIQYADFAVWQRQWLAEHWQTQLAYWQQQLNHLLLLQLPTDKPRPSMPILRGKRKTLILSKALSNALKSLSAKEGATLFMMLLAAFTTLLHWLTNQDDIVVGTDIANRNQAETEGLIGFFVNQLVLRTNVSGNPTFRELLAQVRRVTLEAHAHQDLPFDKLVEALNPERSLNRAPLFQVKLVMQNVPTPPLELPGLTLGFLEVDNGTSEFDLLLNVMETEEQLIGLVLAYKTDLFEDSTIARILARLETLLDNIVAQPNINLNALKEILSEADRLQQSIQEQEYQKTVGQKLSNIKRKSLKLGEKL